MNDFNSKLEELSKLIETGTQIWLLGAGASFDAKIPLMHQLTRRVSSIVDHPYAGLLAEIRSELETNAHIEHVLSHIGDLIAIAARRKIGKVNVGAEIYSHEALVDLHSEIVRCITETIRYGYREATEASPEEIGDSKTPIVEVKYHLSFMNALFKGRTNLESRSRVVFTTTNYDTLIEDALSLQKRRVIDGFSNGGIGFWIGHGETDFETLPTRSHPVIKLHGSVDWVREDNGKMFRSRYGTRYLSNLANTLIYPQATKYVETQRDPFAQLFSAFRNLLSSRQSHVLCIVGYSFGDEHINSEIEEALKREGNKTNIVAFVKEIDGPNGEKFLPKRLNDWVNSDLYKNRVFVASDRALYAGGARVVPLGERILNWWNFSGLTNFLITGSPN